MNLELEEQIELMKKIDEVLYQHTQRNRETPNILLLDVLNWHKLQSLPDIEENSALIDGMREGKYKGVDVLQVNDPCCYMPDRKSIGTIIMAGKVI